MWQLLATNRDFRRLWAATTVDSFGSWLLVMALPLHVFTMTRSAMSTGLALAAQALPAVLVGPWAGVVVDRRHRRTVLVVANLLATAAVALLVRGHLPLIYLGLTLENVALCFLRPALSAATPALVGPPDLASANSLSALTNAIFRMLGPLAGTVLVAAGHFRAVVLADVATYAIAAAIISTVALPEVRRPVRAVAGLHHICRTPLLPALLLAGCLFWTANAALTALLAPFVALRLHSSGRAVGYLIAGLGLGYVGGSTLAKALIARCATGRLLTAAYATVGACFLVTFGTTSLPIAVVALTAAGVPGAVAQIVVAHTVQSSTPDAVLGRTAAAFSTSDCVAAVAGALLGPAVAAFTGLGVALDVLSALILLAAVLMAVLPRISAGRQ